VPNTQNGKCNQLIPGKSKEFGGVGQEWLQGESIKKPSKS
jgi:hypothetical protein